MYILYVLYSLHHLTDIKYNIHMYCIQYNDNFNV